MSVCLLCRNSFPQLSGKMILDGYICHNCYKNLPYVIRRDISNYSDITLECVMDYCKAHQDDFTETAHYGELYIDEAKGLFAFKEKEKNMKYSVFDIMDVDDISIYCVNASANKYNNVRCDVEITCVLNHPSIKIRHIIKKNVACLSKDAGYNKLEWTEPGDLSMFRSMIDQMYITKIKKHSSNYKDYLKTYQSIELLKAKALFMINEDVYDIDYLKKQRNALIKNFHPDENNYSVEESNRYAQIGNSAYHLLVENYQGGTV